MFKEFVFSIWTHKYIYLISRNRVYMGIFNFFLAVILLFYFSNNSCIFLPGVNTKGVKPQLLHFNKDKTLLRQLFQEQFPSHFIIPHSESTLWVFPGWLCVCVTCFLSPQASQLCCMESAPGSLPVSQRLFTPATAQSLFIFSIKKMKEPCTDQYLSSGGFCAANTCCF